MSLIIDLFLSFNYRQCSLTVFACRENVFQSDDLKADLGQNVNRVDDCWESHSPLAPSPIQCGIGHESATCHCLVKSNRECTHLLLPCQLHEKKLPSPPVLKLVIYVNTPMFLLYSSTTRGFKMSSCPSGADRDLLFFVTKLSSWMVFSMVTGLLSIHLSAIMLPSSCADTVSPILRSSLCLCGHPSPIHLHCPTITEPESSEVTEEGRTAVIVSVKTW